MCLTVLLMMLIVMAALCEGEYFIYEHGEPHNICTFSFFA